MRGAAQASASFHSVPTAQKGFKIQREAAARTCTHTAQQPHPLLTVGAFDVLESVGLLEPYRRWARPVAALCVILIQGVGVSEQGYHPMGALWSQHDKRPMLAVARDTARAVRAVRAWKGVHAEFGGKMPRGPFWYMPPARLLMGGYAFLMGGYADAKPTRYQANTTASGPCLRMR